MNREFLLSEYHRAFAGESSGDALRVYRAPGRINFIGEHTDYNEGFVMPAAIDRAAYVVSGKRTDGRLVIRSLEFNETVEFSLDAIGEKLETHHWSDYARGAAAVLSEWQSLNLTGANLLIASEVPLGSGLSSSAALEVSVALALLGDAREILTRTEIAAACQRAENEYAGANCGIMDQYASTFGKRGNAILLDCRTREHQYLTLPESFDIVVCNTMVKHALGTDGEYNRRRLECEEAVAFLREKLNREIKSLRDVTLADLKYFEKEMPNVIFRRARHVITENERVIYAADSLEENDLESFGALLYASHESLRNDYEVSCRELDLMVEAAKNIEGFYGGRMIGGGFGGCTINLVGKEFTANFQSEIAARYEQATNIKPEIYICQTADGASEF